MALKNLYSRDGHLILARCSQCGRCNYIDPHGTTGPCKCAAEWTEHESIPRSARVGFTLTVVDSATASSRQNGDRMERTSQMDWTRIEVDRFEDRPLWWHLRGLQQTASGYGSKLTTSRVAVLPDGRKRRVYVTIYSNIGTAWIVLDGERRIVD